MQEEIQEITLWRKYYFSLPVESLFKALSYREVPTFLLDFGDDYVARLYRLLDEADENRRRYEYAKHLVLKHITFIKRCELRIQDAPVLVKAGRKLLKTSKYILFIYPNENVIVRKFEAKTVGGVRIFWSYSWHENSRAFLESEFECGSVFEESYVLKTISDSLKFDYWIMGKYLMRKNANNPTLPSVPDACKSEMSVSSNSQFIRI